ncbi:MAG: Calx-beta domain-containing protein, partial [Candidatus Eisenbacteria bacterium]
MRFSSTIRLGALLALLLRAGSAAGQPVLSIADASTVEGDTGSHMLTFTVRLSDTTSAPVSFHYGTIDGTATAADSDYVPVSGDLPLDPGVTEAFIDVPILGDSLLEANERFTVMLSGIVNADPGDTVAVGTILNDERTRFARFATGIPDFGPGTLAPTWGDVDGDGRPDLPMYHNIGGVFEEMAGFRQLLGDGNYHGGAWCDYDRDGDMDLVLMPYGDDESSYNYTRLLKNTPSGFIDIGSAVNVDVSGHGETPVWADFDGDGWPDLFLPFYAHVFPFRSFFYRNLHNGAFDECADSAGVALRGLPIWFRPEGATAADWNGDGAIDLYCASHLFINDGNARF